MKRGDPQMGQSCLNLLPAEVWEHVLYYLRPEDLLACRLVSRNFLSLVDDTYECQIWKPYFPIRRVADVNSRFLVKCRGTRFSSAGDVDEFLQDTNDIDKNENPFINRTIILHCRSVENYIQMFTRLPELIGKFGECVYHCLYYVHTDVIASIESIPMILKLKNMRSLTIYAVTWAHDAIRTFVENWKSMSIVKPIELRKFFSLNIFGYHSEEAVKAFAGYGQRIKKLTCWGERLSRAASIWFVKQTNEIFPNVEEFKICHTSCHLVDALSKSAWPLKRLAINLHRGADDVNMDEFMKAFTIFSPTLEALHLQMNNYKMTGTIGKNTVEFPRLTDLRLPYNFLNKYNIRDLVGINKSFGHIKYLQLVDFEEHQGCLEEKRLQHKKVIDQFLDILSKSLPSLEIISVRFKVYSEQFRSVVAIVTKYERSVMQM